MKQREKNRISQDFSEVVLDEVEEKRKLHEMNLSFQAVGCKGVSNAFLCRIKFGGGIFTGYAEPRNLIETKLLIEHKLKTQTVPDKKQSVEVRKVKKKEENNINVHASESEDQEKTWEKNENMIEEEEELDGSVVADKMEEEVEIEEKKKNTFEEEEEEDAKEEIVFRLITKRGKTCSFTLSEMKIVGYDDKELCVELIVTRKNPKNGGEGMLLLQFGEKNFKVALSYLRRFEKINNEKVRGIGNSELQKRDVHKDYLDKNLPLKEDPKKSKSWFGDIKKCDISGDISGVELDPTLGWRETATWMGFIFVDCGRNVWKVMTSAMSESIKEGLKYYINSNKTIFDVADDIRLYEDREKQNLPKNEVEAGFDANIIKFLREQRLRDAWKYEVEKIEGNNNIFSANYGRVMKKVIEWAKKKQKKRGMSDSKEQKYEISLRDIQKKLDIVWRHRWDVEELRDLIICQLLTQTNIIKFTKISTNSFMEVFYEAYDHDIRNFEEYGHLQPSQESKHAKSRVKEVNISNDDEESEGEEVSEDMAEVKKYPCFDEVLAMFHSKFDGLEIEKISFDVYMMKRRVELKRNLVTLKRKARLVKMDVEEMRDVYGGTSLLLRGIKDEISKLSNSKDKVEQLKEKKKEERRMSVQISREDRLIRERQEKLNLQNEKIASVEKLVETCKAELERWRMNNSEFLRRRREGLTKYFRAKVENEKFKSVLNLPVKLVLSVKLDRMNREKSVLESLGDYMLKTFDEQLKMEFFTFGHVHSSVMIGSLGIHWLANGFVHLKQLSLAPDYEDVLCVDTHSELILSSSDFYKQVGELAATIIHYNTNYEYQPWSLLKKGNDGKNVRKNCQQFTEDFLKMLSEDYHLYAEVHQFIEHFKKKMCGKKIEVVEKSRFMVISRTSDFFTIYGEQIMREEKKFPIVTEGAWLFSSGVEYLYFNSHAHVDEFISLLFQGKNDDIKLAFQLEFPGLFQLLKGFCRSYWMKNKSEEENSRFSQKEGGCPLK